MNSSVNKLKRSKNNIFFFKLYLIASDILKERIIAYWIVKRPKIRSCLFIRYATLQYLFRCWLYRLITQSRFSTLGNDYFRRLLRIQRNWQRRMIPIIVPVNWIFQRIYLLFPYLIITFKVERRNLHSPQNIYFIQNYFFYIFTRRHKNICNKCFG